MTIDELRDYYGNCNQFGKRTRMSTSSFLNWVKWGYIPIASQHKLEILTGGELVARVRDTPLTENVRRGANG